LTIIKKILSSKIYKFLTNIYVAITIIFLIWMVFFDVNSFLSHYQLNSEINELKEQKKNLEIEIEKDKKLIEYLKDMDNYEAFAREKYFMKKKDEEIYIIEYADSLKN
tara:strand:+ start:8916 stop:9239 length:324 start_codon:yes stop_codon:yes gene_type:complete